MVPGPSPPIAPLPGDRRAKPYGASRICRIVLGMGCPCLSVAQRVLGGEIPGRRARCCGREEQPLRLPCSRLVPGGSRSKSNHEHCLRCIARHHRGIQVLWREGRGPLQASSSSLPPSLTSPLSTALPVPQVFSSRPEQDEAPPQRLRPLFRYHRAPPAAAPRRHHDVLPPERRAGGSTERWVRG